MNTKLQIYIKEQFPFLFTNGIEFSVNDGYFPLILFTCRYITQYCDEQNYLADKFPDSYKKCEIPTIFSITKDDEGFLAIKTDTNNTKLINFIEFIRYISGNTCEISGLLIDNVYTSRKGLPAVINRKYLENTDRYSEINSPELVKLFQSCFNNPIYKQLEFDF